MNLFETLDWSVWKTLSQEVKTQLISQVFMYFVSPLKKISSVQAVEYTMGGIKCATFECVIDGEAFVFIPGNKETILGWDSGLQGVPLEAWHDKIENETAAVQKILTNYQLKTNDDWSIFLNESTSPLRKVAIPPMLVQKIAQPIGTSYVGTVNLITGEFFGNQEAFSKIEAEFRKSLALPTSFEESLSWQQPRKIFLENQFYAQQSITTDTYRVYQHQAQTFAQLKQTLNQEVFDLLDEDQWEYAVGAGSRRLFRWGNGLNADAPIQKAVLHESIEHVNMFGLSVAVELDHWELTDSLSLKLENWKSCGQTLLDILPQSSYYRSRQSVKQDEGLMSTQYFYRKTIRIQPE